MDTLRQAIFRTEAGEALALVTVIRVSGSAPRHPGASMLVSARGATYGTIGGGRVELAATTEAAQVAAGEPARRISHHLVRDLAMCCGGGMELYIEPVAPSLDTLRQVMDRWQARVPVVLITPLDGSPKRLGELPAGMTAWPALDQAHQPPVFIEPIWPADRVILFGAGHVARALGPVAAHAGFTVAVCDDGETGALERVRGEPWASAIVESFDVRDVQADLGPLGPGDYVLVMTREHAVDLSIIERLLPNEGLAYLGLIGSRGKIGRFHKRLVAKGIATQERWARLHAPIGLDIGAETPEEIAVATVAELIQVRRRGRTRADAAGGP